LLVGGIYFESVRDAVGCDFDAVGIFGEDGAIFLRCGEEVDYGEGESFPGVCCLQ
jgi:hypothetical protein